MLKNAKYQPLDLTKDKIIEKYDVIIETLVFNEIIKRNVLTILGNIKGYLNKNGIFIMIDRHLFPALNLFFYEIKGGKFPLETSGGTFDYYYYIGRKNQ